jgi:hypothetical protein
VQHSRTERRKQRSSLAFTRKMRQEERAIVHHWRLRQNLLGQAVTELNFQSRRRSAAGTAGGPMSLTRVSLPCLLALAIAICLAGLSGLAAGCRGAAVVQ